MRTSDFACQTTNAANKFLFPTQAKINEILASGKLHCLVGFENDDKDGTGSCLNFIMSNGGRSFLRDEGVK